MSIFFVVGTGRCGTMTLHHLLGSVPDCVCLHEGRDLKAGIWLKSLVTEFELARSNQGSPTLLRELYGMERIDFIDYCVSQGKHFGDSNHYAHPFIEFPQQQYPEAKFIHLIRNGYETVVSWEARKRSIYPKEGTRASRYERANPEPFPDDPWYAQWASFKRREKIIWYWAHVNDLIDKRLRRPAPERSMVVRLEELDEDKMNEVVDFLGLPRSWDRAQLKVTNRNGKPLRRWWNANQLQQFRQIAGDVAERFGYRVFDTESDMAAVLEASRSDPSQLRQFLLRSVTVT